MRNLPEGLLAEFLATVLAKSRKRFHAFSPALQTNERDGTRFAARATLFSTYY